MSDLLLKAGGHNWLFFPTDAQPHVNCGSAACADDLPTTTDLTVEAWARLKPGSPAGALVTKTQGSTKGWLLYHITGRPKSRVNYEDNNADRFADDAIDDGAPHHIAFTLNHTTKTITLWVDGVSKGSDPGTGDYVADATIDLAIGSYQDGISINFQGYLGGWARVSSTIRYTVPFTPNPPGDPPALDADTVAQWNFTEGQGTTLADAKSCADGTITAAQWVML